MLPLTNSRYVNIPQFTEIVEGIVKNQIKPLSNQIAELSTVIQTFAKENYQLRAEIV